MTGQPRSSTVPTRRCPWPRCTQQTRRLMCRGHWYQLPAGIRGRILDTYRPGQTAATASPEYLEALRDALTYARQAAGSDPSAGGAS